MTTERDLIYTIHDTVRAGKTNQDDPIGERLLRSYLREHRGKHLHKNYMRGMLIPDECFQDLGDINFQAFNGEFRSVQLPKIIRFRENFGMIAELDDYSISIVSETEYKNSKKNQFNKYHPLLKFINRRLYLSTGQEQTCELNDVSNSAMNRAVRKIRELAGYEGININLKAVLVNPDDETNYDWTSDPYPFPDEFVQDLMNSVTARDFNIFLRTKSDETGDKRENSASYNTREEA